MKIVFIEPLGMNEEVVRTRCRELSGKGHSIVFYDDRNEQEEVLIERAKEADIVVVSNIPLRKHFFESCPKLKMLSVAFTGVDHIDLEECRKRRITVCNAAGYSSEAVAELAVGMMISVYRKIAGGDAIVRVGGDRQNFLGTELYGKTAGILGTGAIGRRVAQLLQVFGCKLIAYNRTPRDIPGIRFVDKETLFKEADIVTLHLPLTAETKDFVGEKEFSMMSPKAILVNTARGPIVNSEALYEALKKGKIAGAAIDVYDQEPPLPINYPLFNAPNLLMLPHMGYATKEAFTSRLEIVIKNIGLWLEGEPQNIIQ